MPSTISPIARSYPPSLLFRKAYSRLKILLLPPSCRPTSLTIAINSCILGPTLALKGRTNSEIAMPPPSTGIAARTSSSVGKGSAGAACAEREGDWAREPEGEVGREGVGVRFDGEAGGLRPLGVRTPFLTLGRPGREVSVSLPEP